MAKLILTENFPQMDQQLIDYVQSVLVSEDISNADDIYDAIGEMLLSVAQDEMEEGDILIVCQTLFETLNISENGSTKNHELKKLDSSGPIKLASFTSNYESMSENWKSIWTAQKEVASQVDSKKLLKAEAKLKAKQERRDADSTETNFVFSNKQATASQMMSKRDIKSDIKGTNKTKDIKIENFDIAFGDHVLLRGAEMTLSYGRRYGLCGRNGIGKSTLLQMISNGSLFIPSHITVLHVEQEVIGDETIALDSVLECDILRNELIKEEKSLSSSKNLTAEESKRLQEIYQELIAIEADKAPARASVILSGLGFTAEMQKWPTKQFSGGWRMRIALARALFSKPDLLLLDEPTNMLDMKAIIWLENYLIKDWESTLLVVSHDRQFLNVVPTDVLHFHSHKLTNYKGNYNDFVQAMTEKLKNQQREYEAQQQHRQHVQEFIDKFRYNAKRASLVQSRIKQLEKLPKLEPVEKDPVVTVRFPDPEQLSPPVLQLDEVTFGYEAGKIILNKINLNTNQQSRICIVGDNGSGKTTLLKLLIGDLEPLSGIRHVHRNLALGYFSQHHVDQLTMNQSPLEFLASKFPGKPSEQYRRYLGGFGITGDLALQPVSSLSGGQKSRVAFTAMSMLNPHILILDEPTNHLDIETVEALGKGINNYQGGVILVSHDEELIKLVCKELWCCKDGNVNCLEGGFEEYKRLIQKELESIN